MKSLVTIGTFDGVHRGHQALLKRLVETAKRLRLAPSVVMFTQPPRQYFHPELASPLLTTQKERAQLLRGLGVRRVTALRFDAGWARMPHQRFFEKILLYRRKAAGLLVGRDFAFGKNRLGNAEWMKTACRKNGLQFRIMPLRLAGGHKISSSRIRELMHHGELRQAALLLGRPHFVQAKVARGRGLGNRIGIPTANLDIPPDKLVPQGVFQVRIFGPKELKRGALGVCNVGTRPTTSKSRRLFMEVHIPGYYGDLYGRWLKVDFLRRLRSERKFPSLDALVAQIRRDIRRGMSLRP